MADDRLEKAITNDVITLIRRRGGFVEKIHATGGQRRGLPDLIACYRGWYLAIEMKRPGKSATPTQRQVLQEIDAAGGVTIVCISALQADYLLNAIDEHIKRGTERGFHDQAGEIGESRRDPPQEHADA